MANLLDKTRIAVGTHLLFSYDNKKIKEVYYLDKPRPTFQVSMPNSWNLEKSVPLLIMGTFESYDTGENLLVNSILVSHSLLFRNPFIILDGLRYPNITEFRGNHRIWSEADRIYTEKEGVEIGLLTDPIARKLAADQLSSLGYNR